MSLNDFVKQYINVCWNLLRYKEPLRTIRCCTLKRLKRKIIALNTYVLYSLDPDMVKLQTGSNSKRRYNKLHCTGQVVFRPLGLIRSFLLLSFDYET